MGCYSLCTLVCYFAPVGRNDAPDPVCGLPGDWRGLAERGGAGLGGVAEYVAAGAGRFAGGRRQRWLRAAGSDLLLLPGYERFLALGVAGRRRRRDSWSSGSIRLPESPRMRRGERTESPLREVLRPPLLSRTILGITLGAIPVVGSAANANWLVPWTDQVAMEQARESGSRLQSPMRVARRRRR